MTVTKREAVVSVVIVCVMAIIGLLIGAKVEERKQSKNQEYNQAIQINNDAGQFEYVMQTSAGHVFVYSSLIAAEPVSHKDIEGQYASILEEREEYRKHTRTYTSTDSKGRSHTHIQTYYSWDPVDEKEWHTEHLKFCGHTFDYDQIRLPGNRYVDTVQVSDSVRYVYYVCDTEYDGTLYADARDGDIAGAKFYAGTDIEQTIKRLESETWKIGFSILWAALTVLAVLLFCYLDNEWLED